MTQQELNKIANIISKRKEVAVQAFRKTSEYRSARNKLLSEERVQKLSELNADLSELYREKDELDNKIYDYRNHVLEFISKNFGEYYIVRHTGEFIEDQFIPHEIDNKVLNLYPTKAAILLEAHHMDKRGEKDILDALLKKYGLDTFSEEELKM